VTRSRTLLVLSSQPDGPVVRHRALAFRDALACEGITLEVAAWEKGWLSRRRVLERAEAAGHVWILSRLLKSVDVERLRVRVRRLLFDFDDAMPFHDSFRGATPSRTRAERFRAVVGVADGVSCGNAYLATLAERAGARATILPTVVHVLPGAPAPEPPLPPPVIGWIGTRATMPYLEAARVELAAVVAMGHPFRLRAVADVAPAMAPGIPVELVPWTLDGADQALDGMHIGFAPLPDDAWTRGKCGLKVVQMLARGRPVVASAVGVQREQVKNGATGFVGATGAEIVEGFLTLLRDSALRRRMGVAAREDARARWSVEAWTGRVVAHVVESLA
jgi:hypothetical protein